MSSLTIEEIAKKLENIAIEIQKIEEQVMNTALSSPERIDLEEVRKSAQRLNEENEKIKDLQLKLENIQDTHKIDLK